MTSTCGFCQKNYPRKIEVGGDTCVIITMPQVKVINHRLLHRRFLIEENDTLRVRYLDLTKFIQIKNIQIDSLLKLNVDYRFRLENEMAVNLEYQKNKATLEDKIKRRKRLFWIGVGVSFLTGFFIAK